MPGWLEDTDEVVLAQGVNVRHMPCVIGSLSTRQNVGGENLDGIFGLRLTRTCEDSRKVRLFRWCK